MNLVFSADSLRQFLMRSTAAILHDLKRALGTAVDLTVFRKLKELDTSPATPTAVYYALRESARFDASGLWPRSVFPRQGNTC